MVVGLIKSSINGKKRIDAKLLIWIKMGLYITLFTGYKKATLKKDEDDIETAKKQREKAMQDMADHPELFQFATEIE
ncbi:hypothetical protein [Peribacillus frigoritolerans]|uniref:hypothetical protein n=1 Tax=Peribacillus castrilensis TaxID=2897690 RepID=UPI002DC12C57|nr:hypothetical protein [Peribacillus castrilensis]